MNVKKIFLLLSLLTFLFIAILDLFSPDFLVLLVIAMPIFLLGVYDILQHKHTILRNFPVIGHFRYLFELIRPEINQYFIESDLDGRPFNRERRSVIYERAKGVLDTLPYGTRWDVYAMGYEWINHSLKAIRPTEFDPRIVIGNEQCSQPYSASILNISAMSYGALSSNAILALNRGAKLGGFYHNTGEGGLSPYHLEPGGDLVWQIGTAYFGCRAPNGDFNPERFKENAAHPSVKMIEIKLSQGAKPGHGGILPGKKVTPEIAQIRGVQLGEDVLSPPTHTAFSTPIGLLQFVQQLRELCEGKPVGFKLCVGIPQEVFAICKAILETGIVPDFITVDGGEGGTGAAPLEFSNSIGMPLHEGLILVHNALTGIGVRDKVRLIAAGRVTHGFSITHKLALGADLCNSGRGMMFALGCIQALKCNTNRCPTGVTTQDPALTYGLVVEDKYQRVARFHHETVKSLMEMLGAAGLEHPAEVTPHLFNKRIAPGVVKTIAELYEFIPAGSLLSHDIPAIYASDWATASASTF